MKKPTLKQKMKRVYEKLEVIIWRTRQKLATWLYETIRPMTGEEYMAYMWSKSKSAQNHILAIIDPEKYRDLAENRALDGIFVNPTPAPTFRKELVKVAVDPRNLVELRNALEETEKKSE